MQTLSEEKKGSILHKETILDVVITSFVIKSHLTILTVRKLCYGSTSIYFSYRSKLIVG